MLTEDNSLTIDAFLNLKEVSIKELCISTITRISYSTYLRYKFHIVRNLACFSFFDDPNCLFEELVHFRLSYLSTLGLNVKNFLCRI